MARFLRTRTPRLLAAVLALSIGLAACDGHGDDSGGTGGPNGTPTPDAVSTEDGTKDPSDKKDPSDDRPDHYDDDTPFIATYGADPTSIAPLGDVGAETKRYLRNMHEGLYRYGTDGSLGEGVASSIELTHEAPFIVADIVLKDGITFHNGTALDAEAVKYSVERLSGLIEGITADDITGAGYWPDLMNPEATEDGDVPEKGKIEIIDPMHLKLFMNDRYGVLTTMYSMADMLLVPPDVSEDEQNTHPVGLGPYQFVDYEEGNRIVMTRFEDYYGEKPAVKNIEFHKYADQATIPIAFQSGEVDILGLSRETYATYADQDLYIDEGLSNDVRAMYFNFRGDSIFKDENLRRAFQHAIDKNAMNEALTQGKGTVLHTHMTPFLEKYYNEELEDAYPYDPDKAKELLDAAGYGDGLEVTLKVVAEVDIEQDMAVLIKEDLAEIGVTVTIDPVPWATYYEEVYRGHDFELAILNVVGYPDPSRVLSRYMTDASGNLAGYEDPRIDELMNEARVTDDQDGVAVENIREIQKILTEASVAVYLLDPGVQTALSDAYTGYVNYPFAFTDLSTVTYR